MNPRDREYQEAYKAFRRRLVEARKQAGSGRLERLGFRMFAWVMAHPKIYRMLARIGAKVTPAPPALGPLHQWASQRELPRLAKQDFRQLWAARLAHKGKLSQ